MNFTFGDSFPFMREILEEKCSCDVKKACEEIKNMFNEKSECTLEECCSFIEKILEGRIFFLNARIRSSLHPYSLLMKYSSSVC